ncbi:MAG: electron transport complex subunit RsxD [Gammaproteobacteria bacterium]|nr:electron transport complex subunit RsxD [Gammaproteobacteria bacterium]
MSLYAPSSPHIHNDNSITKIMLKVLYALIPGILVYIYIFGFGVAINILLAIITALSCEAIMLKIRQRPIMPFITDGSAVITAVLLALSIPSIAPWWIIFLGTAFSIIIAKHLYGGLGYNPFNPAMVGYAMLLISFPQQMTTWQLSTPATFIGLPDSFKFIFGDHTPAQLATDAISGATPLDYLKNQLGLSHHVSDIMNSSNVFGLLGGNGFEWISIAFLIGGLWLVKQKIIHWHIPATMIGSLAAVATLFYVIDPDQYASPLFHIFSGATILGAFFIATDPVSAATTAKGKIIYGACIGLLIYIIRTWGGYPDAIAFAVLLMNMSAPTIDYYTKPKTYGH